MYMTHFGGRMLQSGREIHTAANPEHSNEANVSGTVSTE